MKQNVSTPAELESAFIDPSVAEIQLVSDITLTKNLALNHDVVIYGGNKKIDLVSFKLDAGANTLTLADTLTIDADDSKTGSTITGTGEFVIDEGANVTITRTPGTHKTSLIDGFSRYLFKENSDFRAQAGTNRLESNRGTAQTGVVRSFFAQSFIVEKNASVTLVSDHSSAKSTDHGSVALILRKPKGGELNIDLHENAVLDVTAYGTGLKTRGSAPVLILHDPVMGNTGVSRTLIKGKLNVTSNNGNGWYYQYIDYVTDTSDYFTVDGGEANIIAQNSGSKDKTEYAAFESYGRNPTYITVENGGAMNIISNGYRGMSLAGGGSNAEKSIVVKDADSKLNVYGYMWAIAAEAQPTLSISAVDGGEIVLESCVDDLGDIAFAGSTVYSVGPTTYNVDGPDSKMGVIHRGGEYGAIFADGHGVLNINVTRGGYMYVYSKNSGHNKAARRAAICAQTGLSNIHSIVVDGYGSVLRVINDNPENTNDHSLYPRSAIAFAANTSGNITVRDGGAFFATNNDADSPTIALGGYGTNDTHGRFVVNSPYDVDISNDAAGTSPYAVALRSTNYLQNKQGDTKQSLEVKSANVTTWPIGNGVDHWPDSDSVDRWYVDFEPPLIAQNNVAVSPPFVGNKGNETFKLSSYGKIAIEGTVTSVKINEENVRVRIDQTERLTVTVLPEWAKNKIVAWKSSDTAIATIDANGVITPTPGAIKPPLRSVFTTMTATSTDGSNRSDSVEVEIYTIPVDDIVLTAGFPPAGIVVGHEALIFASILPVDAVDKTLVWRSEDPTVLSVTQLNDSHLANQVVVVRVLRASETPVTIHVEARDGYGAKSSISVRIIIPIESIKVTPERMGLRPGFDNSVRAEVLPRNANVDVVWVSHNEEFLWVEGQRTEKVHPHYQESIADIRVGDEHGFTFIHAMAGDGNPFPVTSNTCRVDVNSYNNVTNRDNVVQVVGVNGLTIESGAFRLTDHRITLGQDRHGHNPVGKTYYWGTHKNDSNNDVPYCFRFPVGRGLSSFVSDWFNSRFAGYNGDAHIVDRTTYDQSGGAGSLSFAFVGTLTLTVQGWGDVIFDNICFAQGRNGFNNDWWFAQDQGQHTQSGENDMLAIGRTHNGNLVYAQFRRGGSGQTVYRVDLKAIHIAQNIYGKDRAVKYSDVHGRFIRMAQTANNRYINNMSDGVVSQIKHFQGYTQYNAYDILSHDVEIRNWYNPLAWFGGPYAKIMVGYNNNYSKSFRSFKRNWNHPGGIAALGDYLLVPSESEWHAGAHIAMYDMRSLPVHELRRMESFHLPVGHKVGSLGIANYTDANGREWYLLVLTEALGSPATKYHFYRAPADNIPLPLASFTKVGVVEGVNLDFEGLNLLTEPTALGMDDKVFLVGPYTRPVGGVPTHDYITLFEINTSTWAANKLLERHVTTWGAGSVPLLRDVHFRYGTGITTDGPAPRLLVSQRNMTGDIRTSFWDLY